MKHPLSIVAVIKSDEDYEPFVAASTVAEGEGSNGCVVKRFRAGEEALRYLRGESLRDQVDLIVVGYDLPLTNGGFFCKESRRCSTLQRIPVVLLLPEGYEEEGVSELSLLSDLQVVEIPSDRIEWTRRVRLIIDYWCLMKPPFQGK